MKSKKTSSARPANPLYRWLFRRRLLNRALRELEGAIAAALNSQARKLTFKYSKEEAASARKPLRRLLAEVVDEIRRGKREPEECIAAGQRKVGVAVGKLEYLTMQDLKWSQIVSEVGRDSSEAWKKSAALTGKQFAQDVDNRKRAVDLQLNGDRDLTNAKKIEERLTVARTRLRDLCEFVFQAEEVRDGLPVLMSEILAVDEAAVRQQLSSVQKYSSVVKLRDEIQSNLKGSHYAVGYKMLLNARKLLGALRNDLDHRYGLIRREIDLWLNDSEIAQMFALKSFPGRLTSADTQRWMEVRVEIGRIVDARASRARGAYAGLSGKRKLQSTWAELREAKVLEAFCRESSKRSGTF